MATFIRPWFARFQTPKGVCLIGARVRVRVRVQRRLRFQTPKGVCLIGATSSAKGSACTATFQTPKGVCLIGASGLGIEVSRLPPIPDAERRLPHWSAERDSVFGVAQEIPDAERRLPHWSFPVGASAPPAAPIPDAERRLPHWSADGEAVALGAERIPDAERRLPHWSVVSSAMLPPHLSDSRRRKASASLERRIFRRRSRRSSARFQTPKGVCLIGAP